MPRAVRLSKSSTEVVCLFCEKLISTQEMETSSFVEDSNNIAGEDSR
jgi:hypothetical protein